MTPNPPPAQLAPKTTDQHVPLVIRIVSSKQTTGHIQNKNKESAIDFFSFFPYLCLAGVRTGMKHLYPLVRCYLEHFVKSANI